MTCCPTKQLSTVLVLGYFDRGNYGDDLYKYTYTACLSHPQIQYRFMSIDDVKTELTPKELDETSAIIMGGGDIINDYFFSPVIVNTIKRFKGVKIALSVGIPFPACITYLDLFDYVTLRSSTDVAAVTERLGERYVGFYPDLTTLIAPGIAPKNTQEAVGLGVSPSVAEVTEPLTVGVCLSRPIHQHDNPAYDGIIRGIAKSLLFVHVTFPAARVVLLPFNTSTNPQESDLLINQDVMAALKYPDWMSAVTEDFSVSAYAAWFESFDIVICMRYHSVIMSLIHKRPFCAVYTTRKIDTLLNDVGAEDVGYTLSCDHVTHAPTGWNVEAFKIVFRRAVDVYGHQETRTYPYGFSTSTNAAEVVATVHDIILGEKTRPTGASYLRPAKVDKMKAAIAEGIIKISDSKYAPANLLDRTIRVHNVIDEYCAKPGCNNRDWITTLLAKLVCFYITKQVLPVYLYGLTEQIGTESYDIHESVHWIATDHYLRYHRQPAGTDVQSGPMVNFEYINQGSFKGIHRSGWAYAMSALQNLQSCAEGALLCDVYVDRTFHWASDVFAIAGVLPYRKPWIGFVHHTFETEYSSYNCSTMFQEPLFIKSLPECRGLIAISRYLQRQLKVALAAAGFPDLPVHAVAHPTEFVPEESMFTIDKFLANADRKVVQVGGWLRDSYSIYRLPLDAAWNNNLGLRKAALKGSRGQGRLLRSYPRDPDPYSGRCFGGLYYRKTFYIG